MTMFQSQELEIWADYWTYAVRIMIRGWEGWCMVSASI